MLLSPSVAVRTPGKSCTDWFVDVEHLPTLLTVEKTDKHSYHEWPLHFSGHSNLASGWVQPKVVLMISALDFMVYFGYSPSDILPRGEQTEQNRVWTSIVVLTLSETCEDISDDRCRPKFEDTRMFHIYNPIYGNKVLDIDVSRVWFLKFLSITRAIIA